MPQGELFFLVHGTNAKSLKAIISNTCAVSKIQAQKAIFQPKREFLGRNPPWGGKQIFFSKIRLEHFFRLIKMQLCAKNHQNHARISRYGVTHGRTDKWTRVIPQASTAKAERPKNRNTYSGVWKLKAHKSIFQPKRGFLVQNPLGGPKNFLTKFFSWSSKWYGDLISSKKSEEKLNEQDCRIRNVE